MIITPELGTQLLMLFGAGTAIFGVLFIILFAAAKSSPTAWALITKKLMLAKKGKGYALVAWDDRYMTTEVMDVTPEGALEKRKKKGRNLTFFIPRPSEDTANIEDNLISARRDKDVLPAYVLDGVLPVYLGHVAKAVAANPKTLTAIRTANHMNPEESKLEMEVDLPAEVETMTDGGESVFAKGKNLINVLLSFDPVDIKKNFSKNWEQSRIGAMKARYESIGAEKERREGHDLLKYMIVVTAFAIGVIVAVGFVTGMIG